VDTYDAGWLAGIYDGEGHLAGTKQQIGFTQSAGPVLDRVIKLLKEFRYEFSVRAYDKNQPHMRSILLHGGQREIRRFLMEIRPVRLLNNWNICRNIKSDFIPEGDTVVGVKPNGRKDVVRLMTSTGTYIAEGYGQHNCFDIPMVNTRLLRWGSSPVEKRLHIDLYFVLKYGLLTGRKSQAHLLEWLGTPEKKMSVSASVWSELPFKMKEHLPVLIERCESDVEGLEALYKRTRHLIMDVRK